MAAAACSWAGDRPVTETTAGMVPPAATAVVVVAVAIAATVCAAVRVLPVAAATISCTVVTPGDAVCGLCATRRVAGVKEATAVTCKIC